MKNNTIEEIRKFIKSSSEDTKLYFGSDSSIDVKNGIEIVSLCTVAVIHHNGTNGCKVMGYTCYYKNTDYVRNKPFNRMLTETYATIDLVQQLIPVIDNRKIEIHLDINEDESHGSSVAVKSAIGLVKGVLYDLNIEPKVKPYAPAASCAADRLLRI